MYVGKERERVVEVDQLFILEDSAGVRTWVSEVPVNAYEQVLEAAVLADVGVRFVGVDGPNGMFAIGAEHAVVESCAITCETRDVTDSRRNAL